MHTYRSTHILKHAWPSQSLGKQELPHSPLNSSTQNVEILSSGGHPLFSSMRYHTSATLVKTGCSTQPKAKHHSVDFSFKMSYPPLKTLHAFTKTAMASTAGFCPG